MIGKDVRESEVYIGNDSVQRVSVREKHGPNCDLETFLEFIRTNGLLKMEYDRLTKMGFTEAETAEEIYVTVVENDYILQSALQCYINGEDD